MTDNTKDTRFSLDTPKCFVFVGKKGSGKDTLANEAMESSFGSHPSGIIKFADPLKGMLDFLLAYLGYEVDAIEEFLEGSLKQVILPDPLNVSPRLLMQTLGTAWGRDTIDEDIWAKIAAKRALNLTENGFNAFVTDCRFPNELQTLKDSLGAENVIAVRIKREWELSPPPGNWAYPDTHSSETALEDIEVDFTLENTGTPKDLYDNFMTKLGEMRDNVPT